MKTHEEITQAVKQECNKDYTKDAVETGQANAEDEGRRKGISGDVDEGGGGISEKEIMWLAQLIYAEAAGEYKTPGAMEAERIFYSCRA